jgi:hypothetical protein
MNRDCKIIIGRILLYDRDEAFGVFGYRSMPVCEQMPLDFEFYTNLILNIFISYAFDKFQDLYISSCCVLNFQ